MHILQEQSMMSGDFGKTMTAKNLQECLAEKSQHSRRYLYFAMQSDREADYETSALIRLIASAETGHVFIGLDFLKNQHAQDPSTGLPFDNIEQCLLCMIKTKQQEIDQYAEMSRQAEIEGFSEIAEWFLILVDAANTHILQLQHCLGNIQQK